MARRASYTILLVGTNRLARADFDRAPDLACLGAWQALNEAEGDPFGELAERTRAALALGPRCGRTVWLLAEDAWTQDLALGGAATRGLAPEQLAKALGFETEPLSGIPAAEAAVSYRIGAASGDRREFRVTELPSEALLAVQSAIQRAGGRLAGIVHPGGLPMPIGSPAQPADSWRRVEVWGSATVCVHGGGGVAGPAVVVNAAVGQASWQTQIQSWIEATPAARSEWLAPGGAGPADSLLQRGEWRVLDAFSEDVLASFLRAWAVHLAGESPGIPVIEAPERPVILRRCAMAAVALEAIVVAMCFVHYRVVTHRADSIARQAEGAKSDLREMASLLEDSARLRTELRALQAQASAPPPAPSTDAAQAARSGALLRLLAGLSELRPEDLAIQSMERTPAGGTSIRGVCLDPAMADDLACRLSERLAGHGWEVLPPERKAQPGYSKGDVWEFALSVVPKDARPNPGSAGAKGTASAPADAR